MATTLSLCRMYMPFCIISASFPFLVQVVLVLVVKVATTTWRQNDIKRDTQHLGPFSHFVLIWYLVPESGMYTHTYSRTRTMGKGAWQMRTTTRTTHTERQIYNNNNIQEEGKKQEKNVKTWPWWYCNCLKKIDGLNSYRRSRDYFSSCCSISLALFKDLITHFSHTALEATHLVCLLFPFSHKLVHRPSCPFSI